MRLDALTGPELILPGLEASAGEEVLRQLSQHLEELGIIRNADELYGKLLEREELGSTGIGSGVAIPHCKLKGVAHAVLAVGICRRGVEFRAADSEPVRLFFLAISPTDSPAVHLQVLAAISKWIKADSHVPRLLKLEDPQAIYRLLEEET